MSGAPLLLGVNLRIGFALPSWSTEDPECVNIIPSPSQKHLFQPHLARVLRHLWSQGRVTGKVLYRFSIAAWSSKWFLIIPPLPLLGWLPCSQRQDRSQTDAPSIARIVEKYFTSHTVIPVAVIKAEQSEQKLGCRLHRVPSVKGLIPLPTTRTVKEQMNSSWSQATLQDTTGYCSFGRCWLRKKQGLDFGQLFQPSNWGPSHSFWDEWLLPGLSSEVQECIFLDATLRRGEEAGWDELRRSPGVLFHPARAGSGKIPREDEEAERRRSGWTGLSTGTLVLVTWMSQMLHIVVHISLIFFACRSMPGTNMPTPRQRIFCCLQSHLFIFDLMISSHQLDGGKIHGRSKV